MVGIGNAKGNLEALSTASKKYSLPAKEVVPIRSKSTSNTSHGSTALLLRFRVLQPQERTYSRTSVKTVGQKKCFLSRARADATPGCPCRVVDES